MFDRFDPRFNNSQNTTGNTNTNFNPYQDTYFDKNNNTQYIQAMNPPLPAASNQNFYPLEPSLATPITVSPDSNYARGGKVRKRKKWGSVNHLPTLAEMIRQQGEGEDRILAHINPEEAQMLAETSGGDVNPMTGLPQFGFFNKPWKAIKSVIGGGGGAILGNMILPGIGGVIGGALGQGLQHSARGKNPLQGALKGAGMGAILPSAASILGSGANALGFNTAGNFLGKYGAENAIIPSLGRLGSMISGNTTKLPMTLGVSSGNNIPSLAERTALADSVAAGGSAGEQSFFDKLMGKSSDFFSDPANLLTAGILGSQFLGKKEKPKSPEQLGQEEKRKQLAMLLSPEEQARKEAAMLAEEQAKRRVQRRKFLPEERLGDIEPVYRKNHTPEEYARHGRWFSYYNNPELTGAMLPYKKGGKVKPKVEFEIEKIEYPKGLGYFLQGETGGQDDKIPALLSDGEYVIDASTVANLGDGNNAAGAKKLNMLVQNIRKHKGGSAKLPPKAKSLSEYMGCKCH